MGLSILTQASDHICLKKKKITLRKKKKKKHQQLIEIKTDFIRTF